MKEHMSAGACASPDRQRQGSRRVLVVDDNRDSADSLSLFLRDCGDEVMTAYEGEQALSIAGGFQPEVVFLDIELPDVSGCDVARQLRESPGTGNVVLVATTALGSAEDRRIIRAAGFDHYLQKPYGLEQVELLMMQYRGGS